MANFDDVSFTQMTFTEGSAPATPTTGNWKIYTKTDGLYFIDDAGVETGPLGSGGGGGGGATDWMTHLAAADDSPAAEDNFDNATIGTTNIATTGTVTWTESRDLLSVRAQSMTTNDLDMQVYALSGGATSAPVTIETRALLFAPSASNTGRVFLGFTNGTTSAASIVGISVMNSQYNYSPGTVTNVSGETNLSSSTGSTTFTWVHLRVVWISANTFEVQISPDGISWTDLGASNFTPTFTPTHYGVGVGQWGSAEDVIGSFEYLRVYESDLKVS